MPSKTGVRAHWEAEPCGGTLRRRRRRCQVDRCCPMTSRRIDASDLRVSALGFGTGSLHHVHRRRDRLRFLWQCAVKGAAGRGFGLVEQYRPVADVEYVELPAPGAVVTPDTDDTGSIAGEKISPTGDPATTQDPLPPPVRRTGIQAAAPASHWHPERASWPRVGRRRSRPRPAGFQSRPQRRTMPPNPAAGSPQEAPGGKSASLSQLDTWALQVSSVARPRTSTPTPAPRAPGGQPGDGELGRDAQPVGRVSTKEVHPPLWPRAADARERTARYGRPRTPAGCTKSCGRRSALQCSPILVENAGLTTRRRPKLAFQRDPFASPQCATSVLPYAITSSAADAQ